MESADHIVARQILKTTTVRVNGRFQSGLLWKDPNINLPSSYEMAKRRLIAVENKMKKDASYKRLYMESINDYIHKGFARKLNEKEATAALNTTKIWYLPHFLTNNINKPGKWRLVFDAAAKSAFV